MNKQKPNCIRKDVSPSNHKNINQKQPLSKIKIQLQDQQYSLSIYHDSTIKKLALKLIIMLYDNLLEEDFSQQFNLVHQEICQILINQITSTIEEQSKSNNSEQRQSLKKIISEFYKNKEDQLKKNNAQKTKYFLKNYMKTLQDKSSSGQTSYNSNKNTLEKSIPQKKLKLYEKAQKSLQKKRKLQKQSNQQKSKIQISYCTFHPNISISQKKLKSKQKSNVFQRLYQEADEVRMKNFFKKKYIQSQQERRDSQYNFVPQINQCSKQIVKLKQNIWQNNETLSMNLQKSYMSFQTGHNTSKKYLKSYNSKKVFDNLCDSNFYQNRLNRTLQKLNINKQNQYSFQPQLSQGTRKLAKNMPNLEKRMKIYETKRTQKPSKQNRSPASFSSSKQKQFKRLPKKNQMPKGVNINSSLKEKKGAKNYLDRTKTQPLSDLQLSPIYNRYKNTITDKYKSQIFRVHPQFIDDNRMFQITPKKLNLQPAQKAFFKNKDENCCKDHNLLTSVHKCKAQESTSQIKHVENKQQIFNRIFCHLSKNQTQMTYKKITANKDIPLKIKLIFEPLTDELFQMNTSLDKDQFIWSLENLYEQLELQQKAILLSWGLKLFKTNTSKNQFQQKLQHVKTEGSIFQLVE